VAGAFNVCGSLLGGFIGTLLGWRYVFLVYGLLGLMSFVLGLGATAGIAVSGKRLQGSLPQAIARSWPLLAAGIGVMTLTIVPFTQGSFLLEGAGVNDPRVLAVMISGSALLLILGASLYSRFRSRTGGPVIILIGAILASLGVIVMGTSSLAWIIAVGIGMTGFAGGLVITALLHEATEGEAHLRTRAIGLVHACLFLGVFLNPVIIGFLHAHFALDQAVAAWGTAGFTGAILAALLWRMRSRRVP
jgi:MFS family permease